MVDGSISYLEGNNTARYPGQLCSFSSGAGNEEGVNFVVAYGAPGRLSHNDGAAEGIARNDE